MDKLGLEKNGNYKNSHISKRIKTFRNKIIALDIKDHNEC